MDGEGKDWSKKTAIHFYHKKILLRQGLQKDDLQHTRMDLQKMFVVREIQ
jgi:hypothetical protein